MHLLITNELQREPAQLLEDADRGELAVPPGKGLNQPKVRIGLGMTASIAGLPLAGMMEELGGRRIPFVRTTAAGPERELAAFDDE